MVENVKLAWDKKKVEFSVRKPLHLMPLAFVLRSGVAPQRCLLSYTAAKISIVFGTSKFSARKFAKRGKVSHEVGHLCTYLDVKTYTSSERVS